MAKLYKFKPVDTRQWAEVLKDSPNHGLKKTRAGYYVGNLAQWKSLEDNYSKGETDEAVKLGSLKLVKSKRGK